MVYKHSFSCKINCTEVKYTATKLHFSPDKIDSVRSQSLLQKRLWLRGVSDSTPLLSADWFFLCHYDQTAGTARLPRDWQC